MTGVSRLLRSLCGHRSVRRKPDAGYAGRRRLLASLEELERRVVPTLLGNQLFPSNNPWNQKITNAPVSANSAMWVQDIGPVIGLHPDFGAALWNGGLNGIPFNVVPANQPRVRVVIDQYPKESDLVPAPIPANAVIEGDPRPPAQNTGDRHLIVYDPTNNVAWEFWKTYRPSEEPDGQWHAGGEAYWDLKTSYFRPVGWTSADAAGLTILPGLVRPDEVLDQGAINHALRFTVMHTVNRYIFPASHQAGYAVFATSPPMGARFRLKANVDISGFSPSNQVILQALKDYGMIVADNGGDWFLSGQPSTRWNDADLARLSTLPGTDFEAVDLTPVVTGVSTAGGPATGGTGVFINGLNFSGGAGLTQVLFGTTPAASVTVISDNQIYAVAPPHLTGVVDITVQSGYGPSAVTGADRFSYTTIAPPLVDFVVTPGQALYRYDPAGGWSQIGGAGTILSVSYVTDAAGRSVLFAVTTDHALFRFDAGGWAMLGSPGTIGSISAGTDSQGWADVFVLATDSSLTEWSTSAGWLPRPIGGPGSVLSVAAADHDRVVAITNDHSIYEHDNRFGWFPLTGPGFARAISTVTDASGTLAVYAVTQNQALFAYNPSTGWTALGAPGTVQAAYAGTDAAGGAAVFIQTTRGALVEYSATGGWSTLSPPPPLAASFVSPAGNDHLYVVMADGSVFGRDDTWGYYRLTSPGFA